MGIFESIKDVASSVMSTANELAFAALDDLISTDSGNKTDTGNKIDAGNKTDTGNKIDAGNKTDIGNKIDAGNKTDSGNKNGSYDNQDEAVENTSMRIQFSAKIDRLINLILEDGELNEEEGQMLMRVAEKEGFDPDEVLLVVKKKLKLSQRGGSRKTAADPKPSLSPAKRLAYEVAEIDNKFDDAIEAIYTGDDSVFDSIVDTLTGGVSGLSVGFGKKFFMKSDDEKVMELEQHREILISRVVSSVTPPSKFQEFMELLEYVSNQSKERDEDCWDDMHLALSKRGVMMAGEDKKKKEYLNMYIHKSVVPKKKENSGYPKRKSATDESLGKTILGGIGDFVCDFFN